MGPSFTTSPRSPGAGKADGGLGHLLEELDLSLLAGGTEALAELWTLSLLSWAGFDLCTFSAKVAYDMLY